MLRRIRTQAFNGIAAWATLHEFKDNPDVIIDYAKQKLDVFTAGRTTNGVFVWATCPDCRKDRWVRLNCIRYNANHTTLCVKCSAKRKGARIMPAGWKGGIAITALGYRTIHSRTLKGRLTPDQFELVTNHLSGHRGAYLEHRVVALLKYGPEKMRGKIVVRHLDGDKLNNDPDNLVIGSQAENIRDHVDDRREMKEWRGLAIQLAKLVWYLTK